MGPLLILSKLAHTGDYSDRVDMEPIDKPHVGSIPQADFVPTLAPP